MSGKEYLEVITNLDKAINRKIERVDEMRRALTGSSPMLNENKVQTTPDQDRMGSDIATIVDLEAEITENIDTLCNMRDRVRRIIICFDNPRYADMIRMRYCRGIKLSAIAKDWDITYNNAKVIHWRAVDEFNAHFR